MNDRPLNALILIFLFSFTAHSQVQLFERGQGGFVPYLGAIAHSEVVQFSAGFAYNIEGRASIGLTYSQPHEDTLFNYNSEIKSQLIKPFLSMEIMEPDKVFPISVTLNISYQYYLGRQETEENKPLREYWQNQYAGGPEISGRFYLGDRGMMIPSVGYGLIWSSTSRRDKLQNRETVGNIIASDGFMHNINFSLIYGYMFSDVLGMTVDPQITTQLDTDSNVDIYGRLNIGIIFKIR